MQPNACSIKKIKDDMAQGSSSPSSNGSSPVTLQEVIMPAVEIGGVAGLSGLIFGGFNGVIRSKTPAMFAVASGIQWFVMGTTFAAARDVTIRSWKPETVTPKDKITASGIAGGVSGGFGGMLLSRGNIVPGAVMFAIFGAAGQAIYNSRDAKRTEEALNSPATKNSWYDSKWSPVKKLTEAEYAQMLEEKLLRVNAEIALLDEGIERLRAESEQQKRERAQKPFAK